ncbi:replication-associated recombination protein A [bacterium]|nr:replication-associated recombination protein A [bacterium]
MIKTDSPLAERLRPQKFSEIIGHQKLINSPLFKSMIQSGKYRSMIFWGTPGCGKTTFFNVIKNSTTLSYHNFSAVNSGTEEIKKVMKTVRDNYYTTNRGTIIFIDEIHRFNKAQQDIFLPYVEEGSVILIGATTENPSYSIIPPLRSRVHVFQLESHGKDELVELLKRGTKLEYLEFSDEIYSAVADMSGSDGRKALSLLEIVIETVINSDKSEHFQQKNKSEIDEIDGSSRFISISINELESILPQKQLLYDKGGDQFYNQISALHKSIRGSDPQGALYWFSRMVLGGVDIRYICRRLIRIASEDIGLADPNALLQAVAAKEAVDFIGMPEGDNAVAQAIVYLALAPKSNSIYMAVKKSVEDAIKFSTSEVPKHLQNRANSGYKYSHDYPNSYCYQRYFPFDMDEKIYYKPSNFGFEKELKKRVDWWESLKKR